MLKLSESIFNAGIARNQGEGERQEDKFNPDYIDLGYGTSVYWTEYTYELDGKTEFYYDEIKDFNNNGWRLPTIDEVKELNWRLKRVSWYKGYNHLTLYRDGSACNDELGTFNINMNGCNGFCMWMQYDGKYDCYGYDTEFKFHFDRYASSYNRLYVLLVKSKDEKVK